MCFKAGLAYLFSPWAAAADCMVIYSVCGLGPMLAVNGKGKGTQ